MQTPYWNAELETKPWAAVERWHREQLSELISSLKVRSRFYNERLAGIQWGASASCSTAPLSELPFTTKDDIRAAQEEVRPGEPFGTIQAAPLTEIVQCLSSSGTTGDPIYYALTRRDLEVWTDGIANTFFTTGIRPGDVVGHLVGLPMVAGGLPYADAFRRIGATLAWLGGFPTARIISSLRRLQATAILATTSFGLHLTTHCEELMGFPASDLRLKKFVSGGEPGLGQPEIRDSVARGLGLSHVREMMGLGDVMAAMWGECDETGGMHFNAQRYVFVELIDPATGAPVAWKEGAMGEAVYTTFERDATPLLRYRSRDHIVVTATECRCGRTSPKIRCIGRTDDMLFYKGMNVFPSAVRDVIVGGFSGIATPYVRLIKERPDQVRFDEPIPVEVEAARGTSPEAMIGIAAAIEQRVREQLQIRVRVTLVPTGAIPRGAYKTALTHVRPA